MGRDIAAGTQTFIIPTLEIERTGHSVTIDGVELVFQMVPDTGAPTEFNIWIPQAKALLNSETATGTQHSVQTLRGAKVRDVNAWATYLTENLRLWSDEVEVLLTSSLHRPRYGNAVIREHLSHEQDTDKFIHDPSVRRMNLSHTPDGIAELDYLARSTAMQTAIAENYVGLPV